MNSNSNWREEAKQKQKSTSHRPKSEHTPTMKSISRLISNANNDPDTE